MRYVAAAGMAALIGVSAAAAQSVGPTDLQPAAVLVMPFDVTAGHASFMLVSRIGDTVAPRAVTTHWVFYSADCGHLADLAIGLTENDTIVVDPTRIQSQTQEPGSPLNEPAGPVVDLTGARGVAIVTVQAPPGVSPVQLVGSWTIADRTAGSAFGANAVGFSSPALPDPSLLAFEGLVIPTFAPSALDTSQVIVVGLEQQGDSIVPIARPSAVLGGAHVCCNAQVTDTLETIVSVPDVCFACALFAPVAPTRLPSADPPVVPLATAPASAGMVVLRACRTADDDGVPVPLGSAGARQFLVAFHGQAVGPFGVVTAGKYGAPAF
ncbi:MAG: hypothetical protein IT293_00670 [Deltaproteobacteria bacterium]|nr:hypothetical protein [Deltaproteobacteria bacterium]